MKRPNKFDWIVYGIFRWWWNPIFSRDEKLLRRFIGMMSLWEHYHSTNPKAVEQEAHDGKAG